MYGAENTELTAKPNNRIKGTARTRRFFIALPHAPSSVVYQKFLPRTLAAPYA